MSPLPIVTKICPKCKKKSYVEEWWRTCMNCLAASLKVPAVKLIRPKVFKKPWRKRKGRPRGARNKPMSEPEPTPEPKPEPTLKPVQAIASVPVSVPPPNEFVRYRMTWHDWRGKHPEGWYWSKDKVLLGPFDEEDEAKRAGESDGEKT